MIDYVLVSIPGLDLRGSGSGLEYGEEDEE
jgi:hypothetical protein